MLQQLAKGEAMRKSIWLTCLCFLIIGVTEGVSYSGEPAPVKANIPSSEMLHAYLMTRVRQSLDRRDAAHETLKTPVQIKAYQSRMRQFFFDQVGELPPRTPLHARVVGQLKQDGYRVEKILFESQPHFFVTALLYLPDCKPPYPGVLVPCGHSANGKARDLYQRAPILIAKNGMAALCYDPIDQGERHQLLDESGKPVISSSTQGHNMTGVGATLLGRNTASYRIWDGMRAIDYLASRPEVDPNRIGCTGISGGGTMTSYLMALDDRVQAAAPGCYLTSLQRLLETIGPQDAEQNIFGQITYGMDHADYILMRAPKPTLMMTATADYFDISGAWHTFRQAKRWYTRLGFAERMDIIEADGGHGFPAAMRVAATRWMRRWLLQMDDAITEPELPVQDDKALQCTPRGEVLLLDGARSVYDLNVELENKLAAERKRIWQAADPAEALDEVRRITHIRRLAQLPKPGSEKSGTQKHDGYHVDSLVLRPEPGIWIPALAFVPDRPSGQAYLYLHEGGKQADAGPDSPIEKLVRQGGTVLALDVRGIGATASNGKHSYGRYLPPEWRECTIAYLLGTSLLAMRAEDILSSARWLADGALGRKPKAVHLISIGQTGPAALHAAALEPNLFASVTLRRCLVSWSNVVRTPLAKNPYPNVVHGALQTYDLPDLVRTLSPRIQVVQPVDAAGNLIHRTVDKRQDVTTVGAVRAR